MASAEGASENFTVFCGTAADYAMFFFFKFQGGGAIDPLAPPVGTHAFYNQIVFTTFNILLLQ